MTPEAQRIAIAEACGWKLNPKKHTAKILDWLHTPSGNTAYDPPNYLSDLNAMNSAEEMLSNQQRRDFPTELCGVVMGQAAPEDDEEFWRIHATAAQRAEAFLRTLELWKD